MASEYDCTPWGPSAQLRGPGREGHPHTTYETLTLKKPRVPLSGQRTSRCSAGGRNPDPGFGDHPTGSRRTRGQTDPCCQQGELGTCVKQGAGDRPLAGLKHFLSTKITLGCSRTENTHSVDRRLRVSQKADLGKNALQTKERERQRGEESVGPDGRAFSVSFPFSLGKHCRLPPGRLPGAPLGDLDSCRAVSTVCPRNPVYQAGKTAPSKRTQNGRKGSTRLTHP